MARSDGSSAYPAFNSPSPQAEVSPGLCLRIGFRVAGPTRCVDPPTLFSDTSIIEDLDVVHALALVLQDGAVAYVEWEPTRLFQLITDLGWKRRALSHIIVQAGIFIYEGLTQFDD